MQVVDSAVPILYRSPWLSGCLCVLQLELQDYEFMILVCLAFTSWLPSRHLPATDAVDASPVAIDKGATKSQKPLPTGPWAVAYFNGGCIDLIGAIGYALYTDSESLSVAYGCSGPQWCTNNQAECAACLSLLRQLVTEPTLVKGL